MEQGEGSDESADRNLGDNDSAAADSFDLQSVVAAINKLKDNMISEVRCTYSKT